MPDFPSISATARSESPESAHEVMETPTLADLEAYGSIKENFVSRGRSEDNSFPPMRPTTPDEELLGRDQSEEINRSGRDAADFKEHMLKVNSSLEHNDLATQKAVLGIREFSIPLTPIKGKVLARANDLLPDELEQITSKLPHMSSSENSLIAKSLVHSNRLPSDENKSSGLASTTTYDPIAVEHSKYRTKRAIGGKLEDVAKRVVLDIHVNKESPPKGYVMDRNYGRPLHEIYLSDKNNYNLQDIKTDNGNELTRLLISATALKEQEDSTS